MERQKTQSKEPEAQLKIEIKHLLKSNSRKKQCKQFQLLKKIYINPAGESMSCKTYSFKNVTKRLFDIDLNK